MYLYKYDVAYLNITAKNLCVYGTIQHTQVTVVMAQWYCLPVLDYPVWQQCVFRLPKWQFWCVMTQEHELCLHVLKHRNKLAFYHFECILNALRFEQPQCVSKYINVQES